MLKIHKASAGSGKTYALTYEYIKLLLGEKIGDSYRLADNGDRHRGILAITFTNKATDEMKQRIVAQLAALAGISGKKCDYTARLCRDFSCDEATLREHGRKALGSLLADFTNFNVSTIDSFFQIVLRTFAREAELTGNYDVELDDKNAVSIGVNELLTAINRMTRAELRGNPEKKAIVNWLTRYMKMRIEEGKTFNVFNRSSSLNSEIISFMQQAFSEEYRLHSAEIDGYLADYERVFDFSLSLSEAKKRRTDSFFSYASGEYARMERDGQLAGVNRYLLVNFSNWAQGVEKKTDTLYTCLYDAEKRFTARHLPDNAQKAAVENLILEGVRYFGDITLYSRLQSEIYKLGLIGAVNRQVNELQTENNAILLRDTSDILRRIISEEEAPFIYERLGVRLNHFLIDEFQDTSRLQWGNLSPLVRESLSTGKDNLIIGDEKQSIYRFRNSDPDLLIKDVPGEFGPEVEMHGNIPAENTNWRSAADIVRFNNTLFKLITPATGLEEIYSNVVQEIADKETPGYVCAHPYDDETEALARMADNIILQLAAGYSQRDIAVLTAKNREGARVVEYLLEKKLTDPALADIQVMSEDSLVIGSAYSVQLIVSVMRFIDTYRSDSAAVSDDGGKLKLEEFEKRVRYHLSRGLTRDKAISIAVAPDENIEWLMIEASEMDCISLPSLVERIVKRCISDEMCRTENIYISAFQDKVIDFCERPSSDLRSFLAWWDDSGCRSTLDTPTEVDALRVMTIHKSKGLEFKCVHLPFVDWTFSPGDRLTWFDLRPDGKGLAWNPFYPELFKEESVPPFMPLNMSSSLEFTALKRQYDVFNRKEWADIMNRAYVAFTRAERELCICYKRPPKKAKSISLTSLMLDAFRRADYAWKETVAPGADTLAVLNDSLDDNGVLRFGTPTKPVNGKKHDDMIAVGKYYTYDNPHIWDMSRIEDMADMSRPRQRGIILHGIMSRIREVGDIPRAVLRAVVSGNLPEEDATACADMLRRAIEDGQPLTWFKDIRRVLNERPFIVVDGDGGESYRPDRIVWTSGGTIDIVDYKFGKEPPERYRAQVRRYMKHISAMFPDSDVRGYLWYPLTHKVVDVMTL